MPLLTIAEVVHHVADPTCPGCYEEYPEPCRCGGLVHASATEDQDEDGNPVLITQCDQCGRSEDELAETA
jgi:hypothetical protein